MEAEPYIIITWRDSAGSFDIYLYNEYDSLVTSEYRLTRFFAILKGRRMLRRYLIRGSGYYSDNIKITPDDL